MPCEIEITGLGVVSPFGVGVEAFRKGLAGNGDASCAPAMALAGTRLEGWPTGQIPGLQDASRTLPAKVRKYMSEGALLGCLAGQEAWLQAGLEGRVPPERIGIYAVSGLTAANFETSSDMLTHCIDEGGEFCELLLGQEGLSRMNPLDSFKILPNMPPCILAMLLGIRGPNLVLNPFPDQSVFALAEGLRAVAEGEVDAALVGAADTPSAPSTLVFLAQSGYLRDGEVASPSAAYLVLEPATPFSSRPRIALSSTNSSNPWQDPLASRLGRTFATAPILAVAAACLGFIQDHPLPGVRVEGLR